MYTYKLTRLVFNDGTTIEPGRLTVMVGANNAGKSRALKDIVAQTTTDHPTSGVIVKNAGWSLPQTLHELLEAYNLAWYQEDHGPWARRILDPDLCREHYTRGTSSPVVYEDYQFQNTEEALGRFAANFGTDMITFLTTEHRLQLVKESQSPSHERQTANLLQALYNEVPQAEKAIRALIRQAFGREVALDFTVPQQLLLRVGDDFSALPPDPRDARPILARHEKLNEQGDGIRSFVGIVVAMLSLKRSVVLIDEPEAFLHPPQAFRIGTFLAAQVSDTRQIILATHSADVLRGILSKTQDVTILRIDRLGKSNSFRLLEPDRLKELATNPLLSSARVLDGLFYAGAVVVEADSDARFYQATSTKRRADLDLHFVNADSKHTVPRITSIYQHMGVRCAGIVDVDAVTKWSELEQQLITLGCNTEELQRAQNLQVGIAQGVKYIAPEQRWEDVKRQLSELLSTMTSTEEQGSLAKEKLLPRIEKQCQAIAHATKGSSQLKRYGRAALPQERQAQFDQLLQLCAVKGLFILPCGELESMLEEYGIPYTTDKRAWLTQALQLLPHLEVNDARYPWKFLKDIHERLSGDETRKHAVEE